MAIFGAIRNRVCNHPGGTAVAEEKERWRARAVLHAVRSMGRYQNYEKTCWTLDINLPKHMGEYVIIYNLMTD